MLAESDINLRTRRIYPNDIFIAVKKYFFFSIARKVLFFANFF